MKIALSIDWDFFFDDTCYDWGHQESPFFIESMWGIRALDMKVAGEDYMQYAPRGVEEFLHMLKTQKLTPPALYIGESHLYAYGYFMAFPPDLILHFDSHSDMSPKHPEYLDCENWLYWLLKKKPKTHCLWIVPKHHDPKMEGDNLGKLPNFKYVRYGWFEDVWKRTSRSAYTVMMSYMCRSGAWTPPWSDADFDKFADALAVSKIYENDKTVRPRAFTPPSEEAVQKIREQIKQVFGGKQNEVSKM